jgi:hypothetical protein
VLVETARKLFGELLSAFGAGYDFPAAARESFVDPRIYRLAGDGVASVKFLAGSSHDQSNLIRD